MLVIVQTTGSFMLCPYDGGATPNIEANVPTLTRRTPFVGYRVMLGQLNILAEDVPDTATQEGLQAAESVESYLESLKPKSEPVKPQVPKTKKST